MREAEMEPNWGKVKNVGTTGPLPPLLSATGRPSIEYQSGRLLVH